MNADDRPTLSEFQEALREAGVRVTAQREAVWTLFLRRPKGLTTGEAAALLGREGIGTATVYRAATLFERLGFLLRVQDTKGEQRLLARRPGHAHLLLCDSCGRVEQFRTCGFDVLEKLLEAETGFRVRNHNLEVRGICPGCAGGSK
ncbi:MAG: Fur family transcriptional regulator [Candidatus Eisenbacteria bacterium]